MRIYTCMCAYNYTVYMYFTFNFYSTCIFVCSDYYWSYPEPPKVQQDIKFGKLDDDRIPFPCTSGARFCSNGIYTPRFLPANLY